MKSKILTSLIVLLTASLFASDAKGQQKTVGAAGTEIPLYRQTNKTNGNSCYVYKKYVVMSVVSAEDIGEDVVIFQRNAAADYKKNCAQNRRQAYMFQPSSDNSAFYGLIGDIFLVDSGTSAGERGLDIVSLSSKKVIYSTSYYDEPKIVGNALIYDKHSDKQGSLKTCPNALKWRKESGGEGWVRPTRLDLTTFRETPAGNLKCVYLE